MQGLNDVDERICAKEYLMDLLYLIDGEHRSFYGFYLRFLKYCVDNMKLISGNQEKYILCMRNLKKLLKILLKVLLILLNL